MTFRTILPVVGFAMAVGGGWFAAAAFSPVQRQDAGTSPLMPVVVEHPSLAGQVPEEAALARVRGTKNRWDAIMAAITLARSLSPEQQLAWLKSGTFQHPDPLVTKVFTNELQELLLARDPHGFLELLATIDQISFQRLQKKLAGRDPEGLVEHAKSLEDPVKRDALLLLAVDWLAEHRPEELYELVERQAGKNNEQPVTLARLLMKASAGDTEKLLKIADQKGDVARILFRSAVAGLLLEKDVGEGLRWLAGEPDGAKLFGAITFSAGLTPWQSEDLNRKLAESLGAMDPDFVRRILNDERSFWPRSNLRGAEDLWLSVDLGRLFSPQLSKEIRKDAISGIFRKDEQSAVKWLLNEKVVPVEERASILQWSAMILGPGKSLPAELLSKLDEKTLAAVRPLLEPKRVVEKRVSLLPIREQMALAANNAHGDSFYFRESPSEWTPAQLGEACAYVREQDEEGLLQLLIREDYTGRGTVPLALSAEIFRSALEKNISTKRSLNHMLELSAAWASSEPAKAAAWVESLPPGQARTFAIKNVAARWKLLASGEAEQWIAGLSDPAELQAALEAAAIAEEK